MGSKCQKLHFFPDDGLPLAIIVTVCRTCTECLWMESCKVGEVLRWRMGGTVFYDSLCIERIHR
jgi:hypothetical protein